MSSGLRSARTAPDVARHAQCRRRRPAKRCGGAGSAARSGGTEHARPAARIAGSRAAGACPPGRRSRRRGRALSNSSRVGVTLPGGVPASGLPPGEPALTGRAIDRDRRLGRRLARASRDQRRPHASQPRTHRRTCASRRVPSRLHRAQPRLSPPPNLGRGRIRRIRRRQLLRNPRLQRVRHAPFTLAQLRAPEPTPLQTPSPDAASLANASLASACVPQPRAAEGPAT